jgi:hypothetical protein
MGIVETYLIAVAAATLATFGFIVRGIQGDMLRLRATRSKAVNARKAA